MDRELRQWTIDVTIDLARRLYEMLQSADDFVPLHEPECNIVAFRFVPRELKDAPAEQIDAFQLRLRRTVIESGEFYLVQTRLDGRPVLRALYAPDIVHCEKNSES